jgi:nucleotide-binding universal stress UspA family protein
MSRVRGPSTALRCHELTAAAILQIRFLRAEPIFWGFVDDHLASSRPVLAIPKSDSLLRPLQKISKILVTTDCSPYSKTVVDYAFQVKQLIDCELFLLYVIELSAAIKFGLRQGYFVDAVSKMRTWAKNQLKNLTPYQFVKDKSVHWLVEEGPVSDKIAECAEAYDVNLVILGAHGYGPVEKHFVGTTTNKVLTKVSQPILTVKI